MIDVRLKNGEFERIMVSGSIEDLSADIVLIAHIVSEKIRDANEKAANTFEFLVTSCFASGIAFAGVDEAQKIVDDLAEDVLSDVDDLRKDKKK